jgi:hypothetical protein
MMEDLSDETEEAIRQALHSHIVSLEAENAELRAENVNMKSINEHRQKLLAEVFELRAAREAPE